MHVTGNSYNANLLPENQRIMVHKTLNIEVYPPTAAVQHSILNMKKLTTTIAKYMYSVNYFAPTAQRLQFI